MPEVASGLFAFVIVKTQQTGSGASDWRQRNNATAVQTKVFRPVVLPGIEQWHYGFGTWVHGSNVRSLEAITLEACEGQVIKRAAAAVLLCNYMIRFVREKRSNFRDA